MRRIAVVGLVLLAVSASDARAQLPIHFSANAGIAVPLRNEADFYDNGFHLGVGAKLALVPLQIEAAYDRMGASDADNEDLGVLSAGVALPINVTPSLLPVSAYVIVGGGFYRQSAEVSKTDFGLNGGAGVRLGIPGLVSLFVEGRGVLTLNSVNKLTYATAAVGVRL